MHVGWPPLNVTTDAVFGGVFDLIVLHLVFLNTLGMLACLFVSELACVSACWLTMWFACVCVCVCVFARA